MLGDHDTMPTLAVKDLATARQFYEDTLGFSPQEENEEGLLYGSGSGRFFVYRSQFAGTNKATAMSFRVPGDAFDAEISHLRDKGVRFQTFDAPGLEWTDGVASAGDQGEYKSAWFEDPDGNILNVEAGM
jgi:catechol 2,3-dioxygenase-like lactoylglutathione lyase family enzyme